MTRTPFGIGESVRKTSRFFTRSRGATGAALALLLAALVVSSVAVAPVAGDNTAANWGADTAPAFQAYADSATIAEHNRSEMNSPLQVYDDNGEVTSLDAELNSSINNSLGVTYTKISADRLGEFPRKSDEGDNTASWRDTSEWSKDASGSAGSGTIASTTVADVSAVKFSTSSQTSGDTMVFNYSNVSITSDAEKRVTSVFFDLKTLDSGAEGDLELVDADGDIKEFHINSSANADDADVLANSTGTAYVGQEQLANVATEGSGDGSFDEIQAVRLEVHDADLEIVVTGFDSGSKSELDLGDHMTDTDGDGEVEASQVTDKTSSGEQRLDSLESMGSWADSAQVYDLTVYGITMKPGKLASADVHVNSSPSFVDDYGTYEHGTTTWLRFNVPAYIDISWSGLVFRLDGQAYISDRYVALDYKEGTGSTDLTDVSSMTDKTGSLASKGDRVVVDSTVPTGENVVVKLSLLQTSDEFDEYMSGSSGGAVAVGGGGPIDSLKTIAMGLVAALAAWKRKAIAALLGFGG